MAAIPELSYNEFLAFLFVYSAQMNYPLSAEELEYIKTRTEIEDIDTIKHSLHSMSDADVLEMIEAYRKRYFDTPEKENKIRTDLEKLLNTPGKHSQLEKVAIHIIEKII